MKNTWEVLKEQMTKGKTPRSSGYVMALNRASDLFVALQTEDLICDSVQAVVAFNDDRELTSAILQRKQLEELGL